MGGWSSSKRFVEKVPSLLKSYGSRGGDAYADVNSGDHFMALEDRRGCSEALEI
mgnify:CR=1 FL=1